MRLPGKAEITEGLAAGDLVVTAGQARLLRGEGLPLRVVEVGRRGAAWRQFAGQGREPEPLRRLSGRGVP